MSRPWNDIDPEEEKLLAQWNRDQLPLETPCPAAEMLRASQEGCLPEPELSRVRQHIASCPVCAALTQDLAAVDAGPTPLEERRMRARIGLPVQAVPESKSPWWFRFAPWVLAAGCAALAIGVWSRMDSKPGRELPPPVAKVEPPRPLPVRPAAVRMPLASLVWRGEDNKQQDPYPTELTRALAAYRGARYDEAIPALRAVAVKYPRRAEAQFYLGVSLLMVGRDADAIAPLEGAKAAGESPVSVDVNWYLAIALFHTGRTGESKSLFQSMCAVAGAHQKEACAALASM